MLITVNFGSAGSGFAGSVFYTILNADKTIHQARTAVDVTELRAGTGNYGVTVPDSLLFGKTVLWDLDGTSKAASESFITAAASAGAYPATVTVVDIGNAPLDNVAVWISTDAAGAAVVAGPVYTDSFGEASFILDSGSYYVWKQRAGTNFANPDTLTVTP